MNICTITNLQLFHDMYLKANLVWPTRNLLVLKIFREINSLLAWVGNLDYSKNVDSTKVFPKSCKSKYPTAVW